jgi:hypothetical protein
MVPWDLAHLVDVAALVAAAAFFVEMPELVAELA